MAQPLTDAINALTRYANETTGQSDQTLSDAVRTLCDGYGQGGGDMWQTLYDGTTEADGNLQVAVTNISVHEIKVVMIEPTSYTASAVVYIVPNNPNGTHWDQGYGRITNELSNSSASAVKILTTWIEPYDVDHLFAGQTQSVNNTNMSNVQRLVHYGVTDAVAGQEITSVSVATYVSIPAGLRVIVLGK